MEIANNVSNSQVDQNLISKGEKLPRHWNPGPFNESDLPMNQSGTVYHLKLAHKNISNNILIVGDPDRVLSIVNENFLSHEEEFYHRGLRTITGEVRDTGQRVSIITSGMGTPSLEIVFNELMALNEIDPVTRARNAQFGRLNIIRVGTSGALQSDTPLGTPIFTSYAVGLDNTGLFYNIHPQDLVCIQLENKVKKMLDREMDINSRFYGRIFPYAAKSDPLVLESLIKSAQRLGLSYEVGVTVSASGFNANQGRDVGRIPLSIPDIDYHLSHLDLNLNGQKILNMEMETSHLLHFANGHNYRGGSVCIGIANRRKNTFAKNYVDAIQNATRIALNSLSELSSY